MNLRIYILAMAAFIVGIVELIIGGILDLISADLHVSVGAASQLISVFSLFFATAAPVLLTLTAKMERKSLYLWAMLAFLIGNVLAAVSTGYAMLLITRILTAASGSLLVVLSITIAASIVEPEYKGRTIGTIFMGISGALVLGVPLGIIVGNEWGWRAPFILISILILVAMICIYFLLEPIQPKPVVSLRKQLEALKHGKVISAQLITFFMLTGHLTLYAYFTPFLQETLGVKAGMVTAIYFVVGIAVVTGGGVGGWLSDKWGTRRSILTIISLFSLSMILLPLGTKLPMYGFLVIVVIWSALSWAISPVQQNYLIQTAPATSEIQLSLNTSAIHFGSALGSLIGGMVIEQSSVFYNAWIGVLFVLVSLACAVFSLTRPTLEGAQSHLGQ
ncbi:MFS transporter [Bacillus sp. 165]|uniref:MFS transporter n=1 Tax=Bacillus sp. 165 TaxID=1529117 RepID=UPI001ADCE8A6|nr:MFS transporter [Bacillus sp. 165]MBO9130767.1 MFS transporter [Bacillus sp. 165]